jgi:hypothetical protein
MATRKTGAAGAEEEMLTEATEQKTPKIRDAWDETVEMIVPRKPKGEDQQYYICVNDRRYMVPANGRMQSLPRPIAEVLQESLDAEREADDYADSLPNKNGPEQGAI